MSLFLFITVVQALVAAALVGVILMQRSEGGGLGVGGSPSGMLSARGAADFLTRATRWLAILFVLLSIVLAAVAVETAGGDSIESTLDRSVASEQLDPLANQVGGQVGGTEALDPDTPVESPAQPGADDPLAGATQ